MKILTNLVFAFTLFGSSFSSLLCAETETSLKVVIIGLVHGHVNGLLRTDYQDSLDIIGIYEPDQKVVQKYRDRYDMNPTLFVQDLTALLDEGKPEVAWVFTNTYDHLKVVEACAPRGIHVIVEKPLAVNKASAKRMAALARLHGIHLLTNLETTWYPSLGEAYRLSVEEGKLGKITRIVSHFGHRGPAEIGVPPEFLKWLIDPELNGGGASEDFSCYGANIITWLMGNERPLSVTAVFQTNKPDIYKQVEDNATIILEYTGTQGIIQASWDWPFPRKEIHIYGRSGVIRTLDRNRYEIRLERRQAPVEKTAEQLPEPYADKIDYFSAVIRGEVEPGQSLSSLENNLIVTEIMEAARESAHSGKSVVMLPR